MKQNENTILVEKKPAYYQKIFAECILLRKIKKAIFPL